MNYMWTFFAACSNGYDSWKSDLDKSWTASPELTLKELSQEFLK